MNGTDYTPETTEIPTLNAFEAMKALWERQFAITGLKITYVNDNESSARFTDPFEKIKGSTKSVRKNWLKKNAHRHNLIANADGSFRVVQEDILLPADETLVELHTLDSVAEEFDVDLEEEPDGRSE